VLSFSERLLVGPGEVCGIVSTKGLFSLYGYFASSFPSCLPRPPLFSFSPHISIFCRFRWRMVG